MRLIDADALLEKQWQTEDEGAYDALISVVSVEDIINAPTITAKEHCNKDCECCWDMYKCEKSTQTP